MSWLRAEQVEKPFLPDNTEVQQHFETPDEVAQSVGEAINADQRKFL